MKKYLPIKIFSMRLGYGWWLGSHFFFFKRCAFAIMPSWLYLNSCTYQHGRATCTAGVQNASARIKRTKGDFWKGIRTYNPLKRNNYEIKNSNLV